MRTIGVVTTSRADYGILRPLLASIRDRPDLELALVVSGSHLVPEQGLTIREIEADGFAPRAVSEVLLAADTPRAIAKSGALAQLWFAEVFAREQLDIVVLLGDRFEMHAAGPAALPFRLPVAHIHGGELTEGAIDDALRHSLTKLSHLHFVCTERYAARICQLGEERWRVSNVGALSLDNALALDSYDRPAMRKVFGLDLAGEFLLTTYHPVTLEYEQSGRQIDELLAALDLVGLPVLFTMPNVDTGSRAIRESVEGYVRDRSNAQAVTSLGMRGYLSAMKMCTAVVGNSSSGIIEAGMFRKPVVNIGARQSGRVRGPNVIDCGYERGAIEAAIRQATADSFVRGLSDMQNPYGDGQAARRIVEVLAEIPLDEKLLRKRFADL